jgi:hypothetical protein
MTTDLILENSFFAFWYIFEVYFFAIWGFAIFVSLMWSLIYFITKR